MSKEKSEPKIKYFVYARKSTEGDERQALSIDTQKDKAKELFGHLNVVEVLEERKSAFTPYNRPVFADMIQRIENGEAQGIIAWHPDRLSRNELDGASMTYMIRQGKIKDLRFGSYNFDNSPEGIMMLQMAFNQSQYSSAKLSKDVKRGLEKKLKMGWMPGVAPSGYINDKTAEKGEREIKKDPERFRLIRKMFDLMLTGSYTPPQILEIANNEWGYRTTKRKKQGGNPMARSGIYKILTNPFYTGIIEYSGNQYEGKHEPMITFDEYDRIQMLLGRKGKPRPKKHHFAFTGAIRCGECGCLYTAETKKKIIKGTGEIREHTYYHCTRRKKDLDCSQRKSITKEGLELMIEEELEKYTILPEFKDWALEAIRSSHKKETEDRSKIYEMLHKTLLELQKKEDKLIDMRCSELIDDEQYKEKVAGIGKQKMIIKEQLRDTEERAEKWLELTEKTFNFATYARKEFITGDLQIKKEILLGLGQNPIIKDGKLFIQASEWLQPIKNDYKQLEAEFKRLEPQLTVSNKAKTEAFTSVHTRWLRE
jgi:site-specific DNA recombinase